MHPTPKAFLLHGFLGTGKTTLAKRLEQEHAAVRFTHDEWMSQLYGEDPPAAHFENYANRVSQLMEAIWTRCLESGTNVVLDLGLWSRVERARARALVSRYGGEAILYHLICPDDVAWTRIVRRNSRLDGSLYIARETFVALKARFEPLGPDERAIEVTADEAI